MKRSEAFKHNEVIITDAYFRNAAKLENKYLLGFDIDRLLAGFRETAGLDTKGALRYEGWEVHLIAGHSAGHYLTACAQAYASLPDGDEDKAALYEMVTKLTDGLRECQTALGTGLIFAGRIIDRDNIEIQFDNVEKGLTNIITQAWVPWYTLHKIMAGLVDVYKLTGYETAKTVASELGDWCYRRTSSWSEELRRHVLGIEYGGMNDCLYELYGITGKDEHARAAHAFDETWLFERVASNEENVLNNRHANTTIPKFVGGLNRYIICDGKTIDGEVVNAEDYLRYAETFWETVINKHSYVTGGNSEWEHFGHDHVLDAERTNCNCETCNTYNMLKLSRALFLITGDVKYADYYENAFLNAIMSSQNPRDGMTMYFQPMATGYFKVYSTDFTKFWCCTGSGMENFSKLSDSLYFKNGNALLVNQYISSTVTWKDSNAVVTQKTSIPKTDTASFTVNAIDGGEAKIDIRFRLPDWLAGDAKITVNGEPYCALIKDSYATVKGPFADGTVINITLPMNITVHRLADNKNSVAFKYGPVVLSALLGKQDMVKTMTGVDVTIPANKIIGKEYSASGTDLINILNGTTVDEFLDDINENLVRCDTEDGELAFVLKNTDAKLTFVTHYTQHEERYGIYWELRESDSDLNVVSFLASKKNGRLESRLLDTVQPGYGQYENDEIHAMTELGEGSVGSTASGTSRYARTGGAFTYRMLVNENAPTSLLAMFAKADNGKAIRISIGESVIFENVLSYSGTDAEYQVEIAIPSDAVSANAETVTVNGTERTAVTLRIEGVDGKDSARLCTFLYTIHTYSTDTELTVSCEDGETTADDDKITVALNGDIAETKASFALAEPYAYIMLNGSVIDESQMQTIELNGKYTTVTADVYAEDHLTSKKYTVMFVTPGDGIRKNVDEKLAYFVDCGDHDPTTLSEGDLFGTYNGVTEQVYGADPVTGRKWGIVDDASDRYNGASRSHGVYTANTWCFENNSCRDGLPKEATNRYTKNQFENGVPRKIEYAFELCDGDYTIEIGFADPWRCSRRPSVYAVCGEKESLAIDQLDFRTSRVGVANVTVTGGELKLSIRTEDKSINVTYIKIAYAD